jgi:hypothetical protein
MKCGNGDRKAENGEYLQAGTDGDEMLAAINVSARANVEGINWAVAGTTPAGMSRRWH